MAAYSLELAASSMTMSFGAKPKLAFRFFLQSVADGHQRAPGVGEMVQAAKVTDAISRSCETGNWETVGG